MKRPTLLIVILNYTNIIDTFNNDTAEVEANIAASSYVMMAAGL